MVAVPRGEQTGSAGELAEDSSHLVDHTALFSAARGWIGDGFLCFSEKYQKMPRGAKI